MRHLSLYDTSQEKRDLRVFVVSLGCPKNLVDTEEWLSKILKAGCRVVPEPENSDLILINTCSFIQPALEESLGTISELTEMKSKNGKPKVLVVGCLVARVDQNLNELFPQIDATFGVRDFDGLEEKLTEWFPEHYQKGTVETQKGDRVLVTPPHMAYVRIADGCDRTCTFCSIPGIRGKFKSRPIPEIVSEVENLAESGVFEAVLVAQDTNYYGKDLYGDFKLPDLMKSLGSIEKLGWLRMMYFYPEMVTDAILETMAKTPKICKYMDIPFQHVSRSVLKRMTRKGNGDSYIQLLDKIRSFMPEISIRTTFIVGFPGETDKDFQEVCEFVKRGDFNSIACFQYWKEEDTPSSQLPNQVPEKLKLERLDTLQGVIQEVTSKKLSQYVGKTLPVLVDGPSMEFEDHYWGRWEGQAPDIDGMIHFPEVSTIQSGDLVNMKITEQDGTDFFAEPV